MMNSKILIIDDDKELCVLLQKNLQAENMEADDYHSGKEGIAALGQTTYHLVVLDVMMPGIDGFETLERIREQSSVPILMLTSKNDSQSKVKGLRSGADDYLTKPFDMDEFVARVHSLIRRYTRFKAEDHAVTVLKYKGLKINRDERSVVTENGEFGLSNKEFELLLYLAQHQGKILTKKQIYEAVWQEEYGYDDAAIMVMMSKVRKKIEADSSNPIFIQTVKGIGYRFNREV